MGGVGRWALACGWPSDAKSRSRAQPAGGFVAVFAHTEMGGDSSESFDRYSSGDVEGIERIKGTCQAPTGSRARPVAANSWPTPADG